MIIVIYTHPLQAGESLVSHEVFGPFDNDAHVEKWITAQTKEGWSGTFHITDLTAPVS